MVKFGEIAEDLKASWYFRIWALLWLVCAIVTFVALIVISEQSRIEGEEGSARIWFERAPKITFPDFQIFSPHDMKITSSVCAFLGQPIQQVPCVGWVEKTGHSCVGFKGSAKQGYWDAENWQTNRIDCNITTDLQRWNNTDDMLIGWDLVGAHPAGENSLGPMWIRPTELAWVLISERTFNSKDFSGVFWDRFLEYHETQAIPGRYRIQTVIDAFFIHHTDYGTHDSGWRALGSIGGFAFFTYILHTIVMAIVGLCLNNDSHFLNPSGSSYAKV